MEPESDDDDNDDNDNHNTQGEQVLAQPTVNISEVLANVESNKSLLIKMSSAPEPQAFKKEPPKEKDFGNPGLRGVRTTTLFRAVNPELFIKPNKPVMAFGLISLSLCVAYIGYLHATQENKKDLYEAIDSEGHSYMRRKTSKWD
ncbi:hypothetical protein PAL_GLEAN10025189 [Pteropus alecto]|uniref:Small integral membrane protein 8 n=2 Tax=Pteropus alecto TaxID=9402 RepID=L5JMD9_PTEAL|nr:hypothetical protein PAL_GLEAN10025189 [Pteropus alecto]